jgi:hypothetical protein
MSEKGTKSYDIPMTNDWFLREFDEFYGLLEGKKQAATYEEFISPVFIMNAIERSLESGKDERILRAEEIVR